jgi:hypothetical protein
MTFVGHDVDARMKFSFHFYFISRHCEPQAKQSHIMLLGVRLFRAGERRPHNDQSFHYKCHHYKQYIHQPTGQRDKICHTIQRGGEPSQ